MGAAVVRAYGLEDQTDERVKRAIDQRYRAEVLAHFRAATLWPLSSVFYAVALSAVIVLGATYGPEWGLTFGKVTAFLFLADVFLHVFTDLPEVYAETQNAIAGWRKILAVLDLPVEIVEPVARASTLQRGALAVEADEVRYALPNGSRGAARDLAGGAGGRPRRDRGRDRLRQDHVREADVAAGRPGRADGSSWAASTCARWRPASRRARGAHGAAGRLPVRHHRARERAVRARGRLGSRRDHGVRGARARRVGDRAPRGARHAASASAARR